MQNKFTIWLVGAGGHGKLGKGGGDESMISVGYVQLQYGYHTSQNLVLFLGLSGGLYIRHKKLIFTGIM